MSMSYLDQFQKHLSNRNYPSFLSLWEEYCMGDEIDSEELKKILLEVKNSELSTPFGRHVQSALDLWEKIKETDVGHEIFKLIFDLQTINTAELGRLAYNYLKNLNNLKFINENILGNFVIFLGLMLVVLIISFEALLLFTFSKPIEKVLRRVGKFIYIKL